MVTKGKKYNSVITNHLTFAISNENIGSNLPKGKA